MKIKPEHVAHIKTAIDALLTANPNLVERYETGQFPRSEVVKDLQERFCFDLSYATGLSRWLVDNVYTYANDEHLYTALKSICPKVTRRYSIDDAIEFQNRSLGRSIHAS